MKTIPDLPDHFVFWTATADRLFLQLEEEKEVEKKVLKKELPRFQLSSLNPQERIDYSHLIEELG